MIVAMPRDGAIKFSDLIGKLDVLRVTWEKCGRDGRYPLQRLIDDRGRNAKLIEWLYQPEGSMSVLRILLLVMTAGVLAFILYHAVTRQISRDAYLTVIAVACGFSLNLIYLWFAKPGEPPVAIKDKPPVAVEEKAPVVDKANDAGPQPDEVSGKRGLTPNCEKELRRTADLLRFFANRIQTGEATQSVVADVKQQEKRIAAVCPD